MKTNKTIGFPTQGELIKFIYSAAGVLPRKRGLENEIDEKAKRTLQKKLSRSATEVGDINENFGELIKQLSYLIAGHITNQSVVLMIGDVLFDVLDIYNTVQRDQGTYLNKKETMKWFLNNYMMSSVAFSLNKHLLRFDVRAEYLQFPDSDWFLPSIQNNKVVYPLEKTMRWVYEICETTHKSFHYPDKSPSAAFERQEQNLESAENWLNGKNIPSLSVLISNFNFSFDVLESCKDPTFKRSISEEKRQSICIALFLARASTYISKEIVKHYGLQFLADVNSKYHLYSNILMVGGEQIHRNMDVDISSLATISSQKVPEGFAESLLKGLSLKNDSETTIEQIEEFNGELNKSGLTVFLPWISDWIQGTFHYRKEEYEMAYPYFKKAFEAAKYCAGKHQYKLVNQFVEIAAKNNKWGEFKKGIEWAQYLGIEIRWLRKNEPTQERLASVFELMKKMVYSIQ